MLHTDPAWDGFWSSESLNKMMLSYVAKGISFITTEIVNVADLLLNADDNKLFTLMFPLPLFTRIAPST